MTGMEAARKIDISAVRTHHTKDDIDSVVKIAQQYRFINVHVLPGWVSYLAELLKNDPDILPGAPDTNDALDCAGPVKCLIGNFL